MRLLEEMINIGGVATKINLYSPKAKSVKGSILGVHSTLKVLLEQGFVTMIEPALPGRSKWRETFFRVTQKGAKFVGRAEDYVWKGDKNPKDIIHQSNVNDIALSFLRNYPDYEVTFEFEKKLPFFNKVDTFIKPDIIVRLKKGNNEYVFFVEMERKKSADRLLEKVELYNSLLSQLDLGKYKIPKQAKVLLIYSNRLKDISLYRPQEYSLYQDRIDSLDKQIRNIFGKFSDRFRVTTFDKFHRINEAVWYNSRGELTKLLYDV